jgi:hypothetical protein
MRRAGRVRELAEAVGAAMITAPRETAATLSYLPANPAGHYIGAQGGWLWPAAAAAAAVIVLIALRWLLMLLFSTPGGPA